jgi:hypothetical protein
VADTGRSVRDGQAEARSRWGEALKALLQRVHPDMTITEMARESGLSPTAVRDQLSGSLFPRLERAQRLVAAIGGDWYEIEGLWNELNALKRGFSAPSARVITRYHDNSEFYAAARESISMATRQIRVTYARQYPPPDVSTSEATEYFKEMLDWASGPGARSVERIFGVPVASSGAQERMVSYLQQHALEVKEKGLSKYRPYVFEYTAKADLLNMALFDREVAFIAVSGHHHPENLSGVRIMDSEYATLLVTHFEQMLPGCQPLADYLKQQNRTAD